MRQELVRNAAGLRARCAELGVPVAYTAQPGGMTTKNADCSRTGALARAPGPGTARWSTPLAPAEHDWQLTKWRYSACFKIDLLQRMRAGGRGQLVLRGLYAHVGVLATAVDAFTHDVHPFFVADATADFSEDYHRSALTYAAERCALVTTVKALFS